MVTLAAVTTCSQSIQHPTDDIICFAPQGRPPGQVEIQYYGAHGEETCKGLSWVRQEEKLCTDLDMILNQPVAQGLILIRSFS